MKINYLFRTVAVVAMVHLLPASAFALNGSFGLDIGSMNTESFGTGFNAAARIELGGENVAALLRLGRAWLDEFDFQDHVEFERNGSSVLNKGRIGLDQYEFGVLLRTPDFAGFHAYGAAGAGYYTINADHWRDDDASEHALGWWALVGLEYDIVAKREAQVGLSIKGKKGLSVFVETKYTSASKEKDVHFQDEISHMERNDHIDVDLSGFTFSAGVRLVF